MSFEKDYLTLIDYKIGLRRVVINAKSIDFNQEDTIKFLEK
jgi:hypothetical protein